jgi:hypothetical protein
VIVRVILLAVLPLLSLPAALAREIDVRASGVRLTVHARAAPLTEVLDQVSRRTGMKVVYDGRPPRHVVSVAIDDAGQADAVLKLLEGLGINYALALDHGGQRVETLIITGAVRSDFATDEPPSRPQPPFRVAEPPKSVVLRGAPPRPAPTEDPDDDADGDDVAAAKGAALEEDSEEETPEPETPAVSPLVPAPSPSPSAAPR